MAIPRTRIIALTVSVWLANAGSAAALAYELNRPLGEPQSPIAAIQNSPAWPASMNLAEATPGESRVLYLPSTRIVGRAHRAAVGRTMNKVHKDISAMQCADWRDLDMGSGHVQICQ